MKGQEWSIMIDDILMFDNKKSKLTPQKEIDIALSILSKQDIDDLKNYFVPICNAMIEEKMQDYQPVYIPLQFPPPESS